MHYQSKLKVRRSPAVRQRLKKANPRAPKSRPGLLRTALHAGRCTVDPGVVFKDLLPDLAESSNDFAWACCPFHNDRRPSFSVNLCTGWYRCYSTSCGVTGSNIVGFVSALLGFSTAEARKHLEATYG